jgi:hypothetical protein
MTASEIPAIRFLRKLIRAEPGILEDGRSDPGWCCSEHSIVASLAFCISGIRAFRCRGKVIIGDFRSKVFMDVLPHDFVFLDTPKMGLFDSSITFGSVEGIPMGFSSVYPDLGVGLLDAKPDQNRWEEDGKKTKKGVYALYGIQRKAIPDSNTLAFRPDTPFSKWLAGRLGTEVDLWGKAAFFTAEILAGRSPVDYEGIDRFALWEHIASTPNQDDFILNRLKLLC